MRFLIFIVALSLIPYPACSNTDIAVEQEYPKLEERIKLCEEILNQCNEKVKEFDKYADQVEAHNKRQENHIDDLNKYIDDLEDYAKKNDSQSWWHRNKMMLGFIGGILFTGAAIYGASQLKR